MPAPPPLRGGWRGVSRGRQQSPASLMRTGGGRCGSHGPAGHGRRPRGDAEPESSGSYRAFGGRLQGCPLRGVRPRRWRCGCRARTALRIPDSDFPTCSRSAYRSTRRETPKESRRHGPTSEMSQKGILDISTRRRSLVGLASGGVSATGVAAAAVRREEERRATGFAGGVEVPRISRWSSSRFGVGGIAARLELPQPDEPRAGFDPAFRVDQRVGADPLGRRRGPQGWFACDGRPR